MRVFYHGNNSQKRGNLPCSRAEMGRGISKGANGKDLIPMQAAVVGIFEIVFARPVLRSSKGMEVRSTTDWWYFHPFAVGEEACMSDGERASSPCKGTCQTQAGAGMCVACQALDCFQTGCLTFFVDSPYFKTKRAKSLVPSHIGLKASVLLANIKPSIIVPPQYIGR